MEDTQKSVIGKDSKQLSNKKSSSWSKEIKNIAKLCSTLKLIKSSLKNKKNIDCKTTPK